MYPIFSNVTPKMHAPLVSIIIPAHNRALWLQETINSVLEQTYNNFEIIIVDDASDPPLESSFNIYDPRMKIIRHTENKGPGASRETGRLASIGAFINYLDSDDLLHPQKIEKQVKQLTDHPEVGMCYCTSLVFEDSPTTPDLPIYQTSDQNYETIIPEILYQRPWPTGACLWVKSAIETIGPWSNLWIGEDIEYDVRAGCKGIRISHIPESLCFIRKHDEDAGLTTLTVNHQIEETQYKLAISNNILHSQFVEDVLIQNRILQILFNQAVFLFNHQQKGLGRACLVQAKKHATDRQKVNLVNMIIFFSHLLPTKNLLKLSRFLRSQVIS